MNDVGNVNVDATRIKTVGEIRPLTAGCIGCSDLPSFLAILNEAKTKQVDTVIIEPTGIADGKEIRDALARAEIPGKILCLYDIRHAARNHALGVMESQIAVADIIGLTWYDHMPALVNILDERLAEDLRHIGNARGRKVSLITRDSLPEEVVDSLLAVRQEETLTVLIKPRCNCGSHHGHNHEHHVHTHTDHGVHTTTIRIRKDAKLEQLAEAIAPYLDKLVRAKGVVDGQRFDLVQGSFELGESTPEEPYGNFIATEEWDQSAFAGIAIDVTPSDETKKGLMRKHEAPLDDTLKAIQWLLGLYNEAGTVSSSGRLRVDWEADAAFQLSLRDHVPIEVKAEAVRSFVSWRIKSFLLLRARQWDVPAEDLAYWKRRLGITLFYFSIHYPELVGDDLLGQAIRVRPVEILVEGLLGLTKFGFNDELAEERPELVKESLDWGLSRGEISQIEADQTLAHCRQLASGNSTWLVRWEAV